MDIRIMEYFLAVIREGTISSAAEALHVSQPSLSRQIKDLEEELGVTLFERGSRRIRLTEEGMILRRRCEEMVQLMQMTESEIRQAHNSISGDVRIGAGESRSFHCISRIAGAIHAQYPDIRFQITSGDTRDLMEQLENGLIDAALIFTNYDHTQYQGIRLPYEETFGVLMRKDDPLASKDVITAEDLKDRPVILSRASADMFLSDPYYASLSVSVLFNLIYNASLLAEDGVGYAVSFDGLINVSGDSVLTFRPLARQFALHGTVIWKKYEVFTPAVNLFLKRLTEEYQ